MRFLLLFWALQLSVSPMFAPTDEPVNQSDSVTTALITAPAAPDTVAALHRLFAGRRRRRNIIAASLGAGLVLNSIDAALTADDKAAGRPPIFNLGSAPGSPVPLSGGTPVATTWLLAVLPTSCLIGLDYLVYAGSTHKREAQAVEAFRAGKLAPRLKKKLRPKHLRLAKAK